MRATTYTVIQTTHLGTRLLTSTVTSGVDLSGLTVKDLKPLYGMIENAKPDRNGRPMVTYHKEDEVSKQWTSVYSTN